MPTSAEFNALFDSQHSRSEFESNAAYEDYRRAANRWYTLGKEAEKNKDHQWCNLCGKTHGQEQGKECARMWNEGKGDTE